MYVDRSSESLVLVAGDSTQTRSAAVHNHSFSDMQVGFSGPILDRIDLHIWVEPIPPGQFFDKSEPRNFPDHSPACTNLVGVNKPTRYKGTSFLLQR